MSPLYYLYFSLSKIFSKKSIVWAFCMLGAVSASAQEGTKQLMPTALDTLYIEFYDNQNRFATYNSPERERLNIYLRAGEKMYFGMKMAPQGGGNSGRPDRTTFRIKDPNDNIIFPQTPFPISGTGFINNYNEAITGPNGAILNGTPITTGYTPYIYTATTTGDHYIQFETWNNAAFTVQQNRRTWIEFFDVTVTDNANNIITNPTNPNRSAGRLWSTQWSLTNRSFVANPTQASFFIYTNDGFVNRVKYEMSPFSYVFVSNSFGTKNTGNDFENRRSTQGNAFINDVSEFKIFLNDPDQIIYPNSPISPVLKIWFNNILIYDFNNTRTPKELSLSPGIIQVEKNTAGCPHESQALFRVESNIEGQLQILLDIDGGGFTAGGIDRALYLDVTPNQTNYFPWDVRDGIGNIHPNGTPFNAQAIFLLAGVTHFPLFDVENMYGVSTEAIRPFPKFGPTLYWDDSNLDNPPTSTLTIHPNSAKLQLTTPSTTERRWVYNGNNGSVNNGNLNTMNSWFAGIELLANFQYAVAQPNVCRNFDKDKDKIFDVIDIDDDNDGLPDLVECPGTIDPSVDDDNDGIFNYMDVDIPGFVDTNGDGVNDNFDRDKDGIPDFWDLDSDNDGIMDVVEAGGQDNELNGIILGTTITDIDADGLEDSVDSNVFGGTNGIPLLNPDTDGDGIPNAEDIDSDNDGIPDNREGQTTPGYIAPLTVGTLDSDEDGLNDAYDTFFNQYNTSIPYGSYGTPISGGVAILPVNTDNADQPDYIEADSDNDLAKDWVEGFDDNENGGSLEDFLSRAASYEALNGNPGHYPTTDSDGNGLANWLEDDDADGVPNFLDPDDNNFYRDTDQDGLINLYDENNNGVGYGMTTNPFAEPDNDTDGAPNYRDIQAIICLVQPNTTFSGNTTLCEGSNLVLTATENIANNYIWRKGGNTIGTGKTLTLNNITLAQAGNDYTLLVDNGSCMKESAPFTINVINPPLLTFTGLTQTCEGSNIVLVADQVTAVSYSWKKGGVEIGNQRTLTLSNIVSSQAGNDYTLEIDNGVCTRQSAPFAIQVVASPVFTFTGSNTLCNGDNLVLTANQTGATSYTWKKSGVTVGTNRTLTINDIQFNQAGNDYTLEINNGVCVRESAVFSVTVVAEPDLTFSGITTVCEGTTLALTANQLNASSYTWRKGTNIVGNSKILMIPTVSANEIGNDYTLEVNNGLCSRTSTNFSIGILQNPQLGLAVSPQNTSLCENNTGTKIFIQNTELNVVYQLRIGNTTILSPILGNGNTVEFNTGNIPVGTTIFNVVAQRGDCEAVQLNQTAQVSVEALPNFSLSIVPENASLCVGNTGTNIILKNSQVGITYQLNDGTNSVGNAQIGNGSDLTFPTGNITTIGNHIFFIFASNAVCAPQVMTNSATVVLNPNVNPTIALQDLSGGQVCAGSSITFKTTVTNEGTNPTYEWFLNGAPVGTNTPELTLSNLQNNDKIQVRLISGFPCTQPVLSNELNVSLLPLPDVSIKGETLEGVAGCVLTFEGLGPQNYTWSPLNIVQTLTATGDKVTVKVEETTTLTVTGRDANGCENTASVEIKILPKEELFVPSLFSPNGDNRNDRFLVHAECIAEINVKVFDRAGNLVYEATTVEQATQIGWDGMHNGKEQPIGKYIWQIEGKCSNGLPLLYQGKKTGKINLVR